MDDIFKNMDEDKRDRIINSALEEFSKNGFSKASTNEIVKNAKISKGLLFHYFGNKQTLYDKLVQFVMMLISDKIQNSINWEESDFFSRIKETVLVKVSMTNTYPYIYEFMKIMYEGKSVEEIKAINKDQSNELAQKIFTHNIDFTMFKEDIDMTVTMNIISWTFEGFGQEAWEASKREGTALNMKQLSLKSDQYMEALKKAFYKNQKED